MARGRLSGDSESGDPCLGEARGRSMSERGHWGVGHSKMPAFSIRSVTVGLAKCHGTWRPASLRA
jgi:hypothetical protein